MPKLALVVGLVLPLCANATSIVLLQTPNQVVLAADSRAVSLRSDGEARISAPTCKIIIAPSTVVAIAGILSDMTGFDSMAFLGEHLADGQPLEAAADSLAKAAALRLPNVVAHFIQPGRPAVTFLLARIENGATRVAIRDVLYLGESGAQPQFRIESSNCPGNCAGPNMVFAAGSSQAITESLASSPSHRSRLKDPSFAEELLRLETDANPQTVGPPFSILKLDETGVHWRSAGACANAIARGLLASGPETSFR